jgi:hypothetical protein
VSEQILRKRVINQDCTREHRCGDCTRDHIAAALLRVHESKRARKLNPDGTRTCVQCERAFPLESFARRNHGLIVHVSRCSGCYLQYQRERARHLKAKARSEGRTGAHPARWRRFPCSAGCGSLVGRLGRRCRQCFDRDKLSERARPARPQEPKAPVNVQMFDCIDSCGQLVDRSQSRCRDCKRALQNHQAAKAAREKNSHKAKRSLENGTTFGIMHVDGEDWALSWQCPVCQCPMLINSKCYACSTGRERKLPILPPVKHADQKVIELTSAA